MAATLTYRSSPARFRPSRRDRQRGLTLTEVLVAVALIAVAMLPLLELQSRLANSAVRLEMASEALTARRSASAFLALLNPMATPEGEERLGGAVLSWTVTPLTAQTSTTTVGGEGGRHLVRLYRINAVIRFPDGRVERFTQTQMGWMNRPSTP